MNPFKIADKVVFAPDGAHSRVVVAHLERTRLKTGYVGIITRIERDDYAYLDDGKGAFHWECFKPAG